AAWGDGGMVRTLERSAAVGCDGKPLPLVRETFDVAGRKFRAAGAAAPAVPADAATISALRAPPAGLRDDARPLAFHWQAASVAGDEGAPRELEDGDPPTRYPPPAGATPIPRAAPAAPAAARRAPR